MLGLETPSCVQPWHPKMPIYQLGKSMPGTTWWSIVYKGIGDVGLSLRCFLVLELDTAIATILRLTLLFKGTAFWCFSGLIVWCVHTDRSYILEIDRLCIRNLDAKHGMKTTLWIGLWPYCKFWSLARLSGHVYDLHCCRLFQVCRRLDATGTGKQMLLLSGHVMNAFKTCRTRHSEVYSSCLSWVP